MDGLACRFRYVEGPCQSLNVIEEGAEAEDPAWTA